MGDKRRAKYKLDFFTDWQIQNRQKKFDKVFNPEKNPKIHHKYKDHEGYHVIIFKGGQRVRGRGPLFEGVYR